MLNREHVTDALRFWELARVPYNIALAGVVILLGFLGKADTQAWATLVAPLFVLAVIANALYCVAYPVDLIVQVSDFRPIWRKARWCLWLVGTAFACILAYWTLGGAYILGPTDGV